MLACHPPEPLPRSQAAIIRKPLVRGKNGSPRPVLERRANGLVFPDAPVCYNRILCPGSSRLTGASPVQQENMRP